MSRGGRGAGVLFSLFAAASCLASPEPLPQLASGGPLASPEVVADAARYLSRVAAYDYALAGSFAGERTRVVTADRYVTALAAERSAVIALKDRAIAASFVDRARAEPLIALADGLVAVEADIEAIDADDPASLARVVTNVDRAWAALEDFARVEPSDALTAALARGRAWRVKVSRTPAFAVQTAPFDAREEADRAAGRIGEVELVPGVPPFTVRVLTTADRAAAAARAAQVRALGIECAVVDSERIAFTRSGPDPSGELWREGAVDIPTWAQARRAAFLANGVVVASADGETFSFTDAGQQWWHARVPFVPTFATPSDDGRYVVIGGQSVQLLTSEGRVVGTPLRLPSAAAGAVWSARRRVFVAASQGPTGTPQGGGGAVVAVGLDGLALRDPFPLVTPAAGPALAASASRDDVLVATTSAGTTDVESIRPGLDERVRPLVRVPGQVLDLAVDVDGAFAVVVTANGVYRFAPGAADPQATVARVGGAARDASFDRDGTLYLVFADHAVAYDRTLRPRWSVALHDGRRVVAARRVIVQDGLRRVLAIEPATGAADELAPVGELDDVAASPDGARILLLAEGQRAVIFHLP